MLVDLFPLKLPVDIHVFLKISVKISLCSLQTFRDHLKSGLLLELLNILVGVRVPVCRLLQIGQRRWLYGQRVEIATRGSRIHSRCCKKVVRFAIGSFSTLRLRPYTAKLPYSLRNITQSQLQARQVPETRSSVSIVSSFPSLFQKILKVSRLPRFYRGLCMLLLGLCSLAQLAALLLRLCRTE